LGQQTSNPASAALRAGGPILLPAHFFKKNSSLKEKHIEGKATAPWTNGGDHRVTPDSGPVCHGRDHLI
jgi:hypothetical protein